MAMAEGTPVLLLEPTLTPRLHPVNAATVAAPAARRWNLKILGG
jgi:hypothetical protein